MSETGNGPVRIAVGSNGTSEWTVEPTVFGLFAEHLGGGICPGVYENYVFNGTFDAWVSGSLSGHAFPDVESYEDVAYPWEPLTADGDVTFDRPEGGVRGRRDDEALVEGRDMPGGEGVTPAATAPQQQRLAVDGEGGLRQRIVLPDRRTSTFDVSLSVKGSLAECVVGLEPASEDAAPLAERTVPVEETWERHELDLSPDTESQERYENSPYGEYYLTITASGAGDLDVDWVTAIPGDAIEGMFNPDTVERLRGSNVTTLRWPGGNYASQYRWRDAVGPVADRPAVPVVNWGGLDQNYLGTNEWLRFCELVGAEPYLTVPVWDPVSPSEAADWVEYCNGSTDTEMGALRAEHGHPEPWNVTYWGVGNEVWGQWQIGRTDAEDYARRFEAYHEAMTAVDPDLELDACAVDPWMAFIHDGTHTDVELPHDGGDPPVWNERLFEVAGDTIRGLDLHRYTVGIPDQRSVEGAREDWLEATGETPLDYVEILVNDPGAWDEMFAEVREVAADHGVDDLRVTLGEWGMRADEVNEGWPVASTDTMAYAVFAARALQALFRNGADFELAHWTDFTQYVYPRPGAAGPAHPGAEIFRELSTTLDDGSEWHVVDTGVSGSPTRSRPATGVSIPVGEPVPLVDAVSLSNETSGGLTLLVNGSLTDSATVTLEHRIADAGRIRLYSAKDDDPFATAESWDDRAYEVETLPIDSAPAELTMPAASVALVSWDG